MKSITTKYHGATNTRACRISATDGDSRISLPWDYDLDTRQNHRAAAVALCEELGWHGKLAQGSGKQGDVFVFVNKDSKFKV